MGMSREFSCHSLLISRIVGPLPQPCLYLSLYLCFYITMTLFSYWLLIYSYCEVCLYELTAKLKRMLSLFAGNCDCLRSHWAWCLLVLMCTVLICVGPDACSPDVCCSACINPQMHFVFMEKSVFCIPSEKHSSLSQRRGGIHHSQAQLPSPFSTQCILLICSSLHCEHPLTHLWASPHTPHDPGFQ